MTELTTQLETIRRLRPNNKITSFLFDLKCAGRIDSDVIFTLGVNGIEEIKEHAGLVGYYSDLFQEDFAERHRYRDALNNGEAEYIDKEVSLLLHILGPHFLNPSAHKVLEMLIRFYSVHVYRVNDLLKAFLMYHDTKYFIRLLQICELKGSLWEMLETYKKEGIVIQRKHLISRCTKDGGLLSRILEVNHLSKGHLRFAGMVALEVVYIAQSLNDTLLYQVLPFVSECLQRHEDEDKLLGFSLCARIALRSNFSSKYFHAILADILASIDGDIAVAAIQTVGLLVNIHSGISLSTSNLNSLKDSELLKLICEMSHQFNLEALLTQLVKKFANEITKDEGVLHFFKTAKFTKKHVQITLESIFSQHLNTKKSKRKQPSRKLLEVLNDFYQKYEGDLQEVIAASIKSCSKSHPGKESKAALYDLVSSGFSGLPYDPDTDLPLVLALFSPLHAVRQAAVSKCGPHVHSLSQSLINLIKLEQHTDILHSALSMPLSSIDPAKREELYNAVLQRFSQLLENPNVNPELLKLMFRVLSLDIPVISNDHIELICRCYSIVELKDECIPAGLQALSHPLMQNYKGQELALYFKKFLTKHWIPAYKYVIELQDCYMINSIIPVVISTIQNKKYSINELVQSYGGIVDWLIEKEVYTEETFQEIIRVCPASLSLQGEMKEYTENIMRTSLIFLLTRNSDLCIQILNKHFDGEILSTLLAISQINASALHLALCLAIQSKHVNGFTQIFPYLLLNLAREREFRISTAMTLEAFIMKNLPSLQVSLHLERKEEYTKHETRMKTIKQFLMRLLKYTGGIIQDQEYICYALQKTTKIKLFELIVQGYQDIKYDSDQYIRMLDGIRDNTLTDMLIENVLNDSDRVRIVRRLRYYTNWEAFPHSEFLLNMFEQPALQLKSLEITPFLSTYITMLLNTMKSEDPAIQQHGKSCLSRLIISLKQLISPYTAEIVTTLCSCLNGSEHLSLLAKHLPIRTMIPLLDEIVKLLDRKIEDLHSFFEFFREITERLTPEEASIYRSDLFEVFQTALTLLDHKLTSNKVKEFLPLVRSLSTAFSDYAFALTTNQLKSTFIELYNWSLERANDNYQYPRILLFLEIAESLSQKLQERFVPYYTDLFNLLKDILLTFSSKIDKKSKKRKRESAKLLLPVATLALQTIHACSSHGASFHTSELGEILVGQLKFATTTKYYNFTYKHIIPTLVGLIVSSVDQEIWESLSFKILSLSKDPDSQLKLAALNSIQECLSALGREYSSLLSPSIMPFLSELLEDPHASVASTARSLLGQFEAFCDDKVSHYVS